MAYETPVPRTANLLACKQWWKVCFLYGDQEKYYRQVYGKAASQRIALSSNSSPKNETKEQQSSNSILLTEPRRKLKIPFERRNNNVILQENDKPNFNSRITVLDDPFLFGIDDENLSKDSGIVPDTSRNHKTSDLIECHQIDGYLSSARDINDLLLSEDELKILHLNKSRRGNYITDNYVLSSRRSNETLRKTITSTLFGLNQSGLCMEDSNILHDG